jgi:fatty-acyl-CoA synthase
VPTRDLQQRQSEVELDDPSNIQYTSGTTGTPKGATLSHHSILNNALCFDDYLGITSSDRLCVTLPAWS